MVAQNQGPHEAHLHFGVIGDLTGCDTMGSAADHIETILELIVVQREWCHLSDGADGVSEECPKYTSISPVLKRIFLPQKLLKFFGIPLIDRDPIEFCLTIVESVLDFYLLNCIQSLDRYHQLGWFRLQNVRAVRLLGVG